MQRFKHILAVYGTAEGADTVLEHAAALAMKNKAHLKLIDVVSARYTTKSERTERLRLLGRLATSLKKLKSDQVSCEVICGTPFLEIIKRVLNDSHDLVVTSACDESSISNAQYSSTAKHLMRKCPCPVWVVKPDQATNYKRILACVNPNDNRAELDIKILELAASLSKMTGAELHIANVWDVEGKDRDRLRSEIQDYQHRDILKKHELVHSKLVNDLIDNMSRRPGEYQTHFPRGMAERELVRLVAQNQIDLTVMGTVSRTGIAGLIIGNTAESVLGAINTAVFTVKPINFVSPVELHD